MLSLGFPGGSVVKNPPANAGDVGLTPGLGRSPGVGNGNPIQYSGLGNPMDRGAWWATAHGVAKLDVNEPLTLSYKTRFILKDIQLPCYSQLRKETPVKHLFTSNKRETQTQCNNLSAVVRGHLKGYRAFGTKAVLISFLKEENKRCSIPKHIIEAIFRNSIDKIEANRATC